MKKPETRRAIGKIALALIIFGIILLAFIGAIIALEPHSGSTTSAPSFSIPTTTISTTSSTQSIPSSTTTSTTSAQSTTTSTASIPTSFKVGNEPFGIAFNPSNGLLY